MRTVLSVLLLALFMLASCREEPEPFQYPDDVVTEPTTVTHLTRRIKEAENWKGENSVEACKDDLAADQFALYDLTYSRGFATLHLKPDTAACNLYAALYSPFESFEIASDYWTNWRMEFTFSELRLPKEAEIRLNLRYRDVLLDLDLAPHLREILEIDTSTIDADGTIGFYIEEGFSEFELNGIVFNPDFSEASGNRFETNTSQDDPGLEVSVNAAGVEDQTLFVFNFFRITSFGVPED